MPDRHRALFLDGQRRRLLVFSPKVHDLRGRPAPSVNDALDLVLRDCPVLVHGLDRADPAAVPQRQLSDLALLPKVGVAPVLFDRHLEHLAGGRAVNVAAVAEYVEPPVLVCQPRDHACLDGREVRHDEPAPVRRNEGRPDKLREYLRGLSP